ncbi:hypothetical protein FQU58_02460, partial [Klebsiella pneumoniae]
MGSGETVAQNLGDIQQTSQMFKNAISMMGANAGILAPAAEKLDQFVGLGSGGNYASHQEQTQKAPDTSSVPSSTDIGSMMSGQQGQSSSGLNNA